MESLIGAKYSIKVERENNIKFRLEVILTETYSIETDSQYKNKDEALNMVVGRAYDELVAAGVSPNGEGFLVKLAERTDEILGNEQAVSEA